MADVVFCEDEPHIRRLIEVTMQATQHTVRIGSNGLDAIRMIGERRPDALFVDLFMPEMTGAEVLRHIRARPDLAHLPCVVISASTERTLVHDVMGLGATDFLPKPFRPQQLLDKVEEVLARR